jgi:hypothetical protein
MNDWGRSKDSEYSELRPFEDPTRRAAPMHELLNLGERERILGIRCSQNPFAKIRVIGEKRLAGG